VYVSKMIAAPTHDNEAPTLNKHLHSTIPATRALCRLMKR